MANRLGEYLTVTPQSSRDENRLFFSMVEYNHSKRAGPVPAITVDWLGGFSHIEATPQDNWRWCSSSGELLITNSSRQNKTASLEMLLATSVEANMFLRGPDFSQDLKVGTTPVPFSRTAIIPPGTYSIKFASDAKRVHAPNDPRVLVFKVLNFQLRELD